MHGLHVRQRSSPLFNLLTLLVILPVWGGDASGDRLTQSTWLATQHTPLILDTSGCQAPALPAVNPDYENQVIVLVNQTRAGAGLPPLKRVESLDYAARAHGADMAQDDYFQHDSYDRFSGELQWVCAWYARISTQYASWNWLAENIAWGYPTPENVVAAWLNSPGHAANILSPDIWEIGVGYSEGSYWVQDFGRRSGFFPLVIQGDATETATPWINLYLYGSFSEMRLSNEDGEWTEWLPFQNELAWLLPASAGLHTVSAEMRSAHSFASASDTIFLSQTSETKLDALPSSLIFIYSLPDQRFFPPLYALPLHTSGGEQALEWQASGTGGWFKLSPQAGATPDTLVIAPDDSLLLTSPLNYTGTITITLTTPAEAPAPPQVIYLSLEAVERSIQSVYLPTIWISVSGGAP